MSDSGSNHSEHELSYYAKDKVKLMKEVLKIIKPKKIKAMSPDCIKHMDIVEINSMLLEELLGISNKRLQYIFNGDNADRETSSSESDEEKGPIDVISLDDISDDEDFDVSVASTSQRGSLRDRKRQLERSQSKQEIKEVNKDHVISKIKKEKLQKSHSKKLTQEKKETEEDKLMNVLELLELQARARAIRSQLAIENNKNAVEKTDKKLKKENDSDSDAIIIDSPEYNEIVITSESDDNSKPEEKSDASKKQKKSDETNCSELSEAELNLKKAKLLAKLQKIKLVRNKNNSNTTCVNVPLEVNSTNENKSQENVESEKVNDDIKPTITEESHKEVPSISGQAVLTPPKESTVCDNDEIVINLDEDEMIDME